MTTTTTAKEISINDMIESGFILENTELLDETRIFDDNLLSEENEEEEYI